MSLQKASRALWLGLAFLFCGGLAAHPMPNSLLLLKLLSDRVEAELFIPLAELHLAIRDSTAVEDPAWLRGYLARHVRVTGPEGAEWQVTIGEIRRDVGEAAYGGGSYAEYVISLAFVPPAGQSAEVFDLHYDAVVHQLVTHKTLVRLGDGTTENRLSVIGTDVVNNVVPPLRVDLRRAEALGGLSVMFGLGVRHILDGTDHLLFLFLLLLAAPLRVSVGHWHGPLGLRPTAWRVVRLITGFTLGHSLTLLLATLGWVRLPEMPVEVAIALTIAFTAVHVLRPIVPGRETMVATTFGLVHGLGFAGALFGLSLDAGTLLLSILGFNLGIECVQLGMVALVLPWLLLLAPDPRYRYLRWACGTLGGLAALAWIAERVSGQGNLVAEMVQSALSSGAWLLAGLAVLTVGSLLSRRYITA